MTEEISFALDIGTRTIVGILIKKKAEGYQIIQSAVREHQTRAMLDGQIHNVEKVAEMVAEVKAELESKSGLTLKKVAVAAAGRALKTVSQSYKIELERSRYLEREDLESLELEAIQQAQTKLKSQDSKEKAASNSADLNYHFVGYTVREYKLDGIKLGQLLGQRGKVMEVELVATFLPRIVIDSLLSVIKRVDLEVENLTLEPIAASHVVIPESMSSFNLALVDIGAGTSDIAITNEGSISGYAMVPLAGDEITEIISEKFLIDYNSAEKIKCLLNKEKKLEAKTILGEKLELEQSEVLAAVEAELDKLTSSIAQRILEINSKPPQAVIFIGGGSLTPGLKEKFAEKIDIVAGRIGIRKREDLDNISGQVEGVNTAQTLTPLGIAISTRERSGKAVFIEVEVNGDRINLLTLSQPTAADALLAAEIEMDKLNPRPGMGITATVNGKLKTVKGKMGRAAKITLNGEAVKLQTKLKDGDKINFTAGRPGLNAEAEVGDLIPAADLKSYELYLNGSKNQVKTRIFQNDKLVNSDQKLIDGAEIKYSVPETIRDGLAQIMDLTAASFENRSLSYSFNGSSEEIIISDYLIKSGAEIVDLDRKLEDGLKLEVEENKGENLKLKDILKAKADQEIDFYFNGSELSVPDQVWEVEVNGERVDLDYQVEAEDQIQASARSLTVAGVFSYINYGISENMRDKMEIILNGKRAEFSTKINEGDKLKVKL